MSFLQFFWYAVICFLFIMFLVLDGADFGAGMAAKLLAFRPAESNMIVRSISPHWDGNEVFLVAAGGSMFATMPFWYASLFSGFYLLLFLVLVSLIFRGVAFEFNNVAETPKGKNAWMWATTLSSTAAPFLLGMLFTAMIQPVPMDNHGNIFVGLFNVINPLSILGGIAVTALCLYQGLHFFTLHANGIMRYRAASLAGNLYWAAYPVEVLFAIALFFETNFFEEHLLSTLTLLVLIVLTTFWGHLSTGMHKEVQAYVANSLTIAFVVMLIFVGLFPHVLIAQNPVNSLLIKNVSSSPFTLTVVTIVLCILLPILTAYFIWSYIIQWKRHDLSEFENTDKGAY
ncbi:cytochrome d ubiquinol oxidase subunit II [Apilactobacillus timberlakei]|uniref:Cytochrome d ubiquinol oxidase subunit II n=1 Tax=Apilactobacillus timberlakei TaxID=2008380 RepID=A0ABY2YSZ3_9LACO|nr:cytochrome d ubiquinol oxidase subunit II [Apilactobacillus timberlakei]TPR14174.1 cytochrome d ubiquinol oxidase subunit II [Apilactobacillus timberlakei]TPR16427.1 cytochrome d ubiquinol oxidase subunit II [Apilactobacillus timberlakei]